MVERPPKRIRGRWVILISFVVALVLTAIPLPDWAAPFRPDWIGLVLIYWCMAAPRLVGVGTGWLAGLIVDVMQGSLLGQNALAKSVVAFLAVTFHLRVRMFPLWQQALAVFLLMAVNQVLVVLVKGIIGEYTVAWIYGMPAVSSMLIWPWLFIIMRDIRRRGRVS